MKKNLKEKSLCFLDVESTGLKPWVHEPISVALTVEDFKGNIIDRWSTKISPINISNAEPKALEINGYSEKEWSGAPTFREIAPTLLKKTSNTILVGHNVAFDEQILNSCLSRLAGTEQMLPYHKLDTVTLAYLRLVPYGLNSLSLDSIRKFLGWSLEGAHTAEQDVEDARRLYHMLKENRWQDRFYWWVGSFFRK